MYFFLKKDNEMKKSIYAHLQITQDVQIRHTLAVCLQEKYFLICML